MSFVTTPKFLLALASVAAVVGLAAPAHADNAGNDAGYLSSLHQAGLGHRGASQAIAAGRAVCELMDQGLSPMDTVNAVRSTNPNFTVQNAATFAGLAATAYCPEHM